MFYMTLLAYAAVMGQTEMVKFLAHAGAGNELFKHCQIALQLSSNL